MKIGVKAVKLYQAVWHPIYRGVEDRGFKLVSCSFDLSCSNFSLRAFEKFGFIKASRLTLRRLKKCSNAKKIELK